MYTVGLLKLNPPIFKNLFAQTAKKRKNKEIISGAVKLAIGDVLLEKKLLQLKIITS